MTSKERVQCALNHKASDRVAVDFGSTAVSGMHVTCVAALRDHYGLERRPVKVCEPFLSRFIDSGFDIVNPVQCSAAGMAPKTLKARYGDHIVFWGGGVDTQRTLPFGTPAQVLERCEIFAPHGGFVFNAVHNIQARTPVANITAMFEAVKAYQNDARK